MGVKVADVATPRKPLMNFATPLHSFDVYSLAVFLLRLHGGKEWSRQMLKMTPQHRWWNSELKERGLDGNLLAQMLGRPKGRPTPAELIRLLSRSPDTSGSLKAGLELEYEILRP